MTKKEIKKTLEFTLNNWLFDLARVKEEYGDYSTISDMYKDQCMGFIHAMKRLNVISIDEFDGLNRSVHGNCNLVLDD